MDVGPLIAILVSLLGRAETLLSCFPDDEDLPLSPRARAPRGFPLVFRPS